VFVPYAFSLCSLGAALTAFAIVLHNVNIETAPSDPEYLFRAHRYVGPGQPIFEPELDAPFDLEFKRTTSVDGFVEFLAQHLKKTQEEKNTGNKVETCFLSMSPVLEWTIHATVQKWRNSVLDESVGLAVFDVKKLRQNSGLTVFRVSDILTFLASQGKEQSIPWNIQEWAQNCDEYVSMGKDYRRGPYRWVPCTELWASPMLSNRFFNAYTLGVYRQWRAEVYNDRECTKVEDVCQKVVEFGKLLAGPRDSILLSFVELLLKPGIQFWELKTDAPEEVIRARCQELVDQVTIDGIARMRISG
jgi:hypothetical protein